MAKKWIKPTVVFVAGERYVRKHDGVSIFYELGKDVTARGDIVREGFIFGRGGRFELFPVGKEGLVKRPSGPCQEALVITRANREVEVILGSWYNFPELTADQRSAVIRRSGKDLFAKQRGALAALFSECMGG